MFDSSLVVSLVAYFVTRSETITKLSIFLSRTQTFPLLIKAKDISMRVLLRIVRWEPRSSVKEIVKAKKICNSP